MRASVVLRWIHLLAGMILSVYFMFKPEEGWPDWFESFTATFVIAFVAWTGIIRWQLPRIRRWRRKRQGDAPTPTPVDEPA